MNVPIYMDNHATTRVDPRVLEAMLPYFTETFGNAGSISHSFGQDAKRAVDAARESIAAALNASPREIVFTSGATESNNLAIRGLADRASRSRLPGGTSVGLSPSSGPARQAGPTARNHLVSVATEHKAILDPLRRLARRGFEVSLLPVEQAGSPRAGWLASEKVAESIRDDTLLVSVMLANNEIGIIQPIAEIAAICRQRGVPLHCDATQGVGKIPVDVEALGIDLMSFSAHKIYGPKGIGGLYVRRQGGGLRLEPLIDGGGQEGGLRSGTLNVPGIVGFAKAVELCVAEMASESPRLAELRQKLWDGLRAEVPEVLLNGPRWSDSGPSLRLAGNLNCAFQFVDGEALMMNMKDVAVSSGSACTSANPEPSHVLRALGLSDDLVRSSLRFGLGRFNTAAEVDFTIQAVSKTVRRLRELSGAAK
ncbi:MAG TPA: cysteine desulfurase family protein [Pirellulaceae bacterium]|nr:cysteine desulfurase family protein [Pirellulaceae bacterium]